MAKEALLEGDFYEEGTSEAVGVKGRFNILISGGVGQVVIEKSFDGITYYPITVVPVKISENTPVNNVIEEHENRVLYRFTCVELLGGPVHYRIGKPSVIGQ